MLLLLLLCSSARLLDSFILRFNTYTYVQFHQYSPFGMPFGFSQPLVNAGPIQLSAGFGLFPGLLGFTMVCVCERTFFPAACVLFIGSSYVYAQNFGGQQPQPTYSPSPSPSPRAGAGADAAAPVNREEQDREFWSRVLVFIAFIIFFFVLQY